MAGSGAASTPDRLPPVGAKTKFRKLHDLKECSDQDGKRLPLVFTAPAAEAFQIYREQIADAEAGVSGLFLSWMGKLPGLRVRLALVLEHLYWIGDREGAGCPTEISERAVLASIAFLNDYAMPMAQRCFGEAALPQVDRDAIALARWIKAQDPVPETLNARALRQMAVLSTKEPGRYDAALNELGEAGWLRPEPERAGSTAGRPRKDWTVSPKLRGAT